MKLTPVNFTTDQKIWCPICQLDLKPAGLMGVWISPTSHLVCYYQVCVVCADFSLRLPEGALAKQADIIEKRLAERYPALLKKLPPTYFAGGHPGSN